MVLHRPVDVNEIPCVEVVSRSLVPRGTNGFTTCYVAFQDPDSLVSLFSSSNLPGQPITSVYPMYNAFRYNLGDQNVSVWERDDSAQTQPWLKPPISVEVYCVRMFHNPTWDVNVSVPGEICDPAFAVTSGW
jgi:hypothetical protein